VSDAGAEYRRLAIAHGLECRVRVKNRLAEDRQREYLVLKGSQEGRRALLGLLGDESPHVRLSAGANVLSFDPESGRPVLEELSRRPDLLGFEAKQVLNQYDAGHFNGDWTPKPRKHEPAATVEPDALDALLTFHGLVMNGGFEHAWDVDPDSFGPANETLRAIGREDAAHIVHAARNTMRSIDDPTSSDRAARLSARYYDLPDVQDTIESIDLP
jgi:hypothetical protein